MPDSPRYRKPTVVAVVSIAALGLTVAAQALLVVRRADPGALLFVACLGAAALAAASHVGSPARPLTPSRPTTWVARPWVLVAATGLGLASLGTLQAGQILPGSLLWAASQAALLLAFASPVPRIPRYQRLSPTRPGLRLIVVALILLLGAVVRLGSLEEFPSGMHGDEAELGLISLAALHGNGPYPFGTAFLGQTAATPYLAVPALWAFGATVTGVRATSALAGTLTVLVVFLLTRRLFGWRPAVTAALLMAVSHAHLHFSRIGLELGAAGLGSALTVWQLWRGLQTGRPLAFVLAGLAAGLTLQLHTGVRALLPVLALVLAAAYLRAPSVRSLGPWPLALVSLGGLAALGPHLMWVAQHWQEVMSGSIQNRLIFAHWSHTASRYGTSEPASVLWEQVRVSMLGFVSLKDISDFYVFEPLLSPFEAPLAIVGLGLALSRLHDLRYLVPLVWFVTVVVLNGALTTDPPQAHRLVAAVSPALILAAVALNALLARASALLGVGAGAVASRVALLLLAVANTGWSLEAYFERYAQVYPWSAPTVQARFIASLDQQQLAVVAGSPRMYSSHGSTRLLAQNVARRDLFNPTDELPALALDGRDVVILLYPELQSWLPLIQKELPGGSLKDVRNGAGQHVFKAYRWSRPHTPAPRGQDSGLAGSLRVQDRDCQPRAHTRVDPSIAFRGFAKLADDRPAVAYWSGELLASVDGEYAFELVTDGTGKLEVGGQGVIGEPVSQPALRTLMGSRHLRAGWHPIQLDFVSRSGAPGILELYWRPPGGQRQLVAQENLRPGPVRADPTFAVPLTASECAGR